MSIQNYKNYDKDIKAVNAQLDNMATKAEVAAINASPKGVYATTTALTTAFPTGNANIYVVTADGKWYYWSGSAWTAGGTYQATGLVDGSITPIKNANAITPITKDPALYTSVGNSTSFYVINTSLPQGVINLTGKFAAGTMYFFLVEKNASNTFTVKKKVTAVVIAGANTVLTNFVTSGNGNEYIGFIGSTYYKNSGGNGFYEKTNGDNLQPSFIAPFNAGASAYDFSTYYTCENTEIIKKINDVDSKYALLLSASPTVVKDLLGNYGAAGLYKIYIPNVPLGVGQLKVHFKGAQTEDGIFYILEKNGASFKVKRTVAVSLVAGVNIVDMDYVCNGDGTEFFGFYANSYHSSTGGSGFYEADGYTYTEDQMFTPLDRTSGQGSVYDFGMYYEYLPINFNNKIAKLLNDVVDLQSTSPNASTVELTDFYAPRYAEISDPVGFVGRWFDKVINTDSCKVTINEGSEFYFKVKNTVNISVNFKVITASYMPYFAYSIDGGSLTRQLINNPVLPAVTTGEHIIRVVCDGLTESEDKWIGEAGFAFKDVIVDEGGTVKGILPMNKVGMFFGDSITEGVRALSGTDANSNGNSGSAAFPYTTCKNLNAISHRVGFGATGVTKSGSGGVPKCITYIDNMTSSRETPYIEPDFIVVNHGRNDGSADSATFKTEYNAVLNRLKIKYSGVPIFAMIPFAQTHAQDIRDCISDKYFCYIIETNNWTVTFSDGIHLDVAGGIAAGELLSKAILDVLGKSFFVK